MTPLDRTRILETVGLPPVGSRRGLKDVVGYAVNEAQMEGVLAQSELFARARRKALVRHRGFGGETALVAGLCPHDDYYYAARHYALLLPWLRAKTIVLFGVFHGAKSFGIRDRLVFDDFRSWHGPYGPVQVSPLRERILRALPEEAVLVSGDCHLAEHSLEGLVAFHQAYHREAAIIPILVPHMDWGTLEARADALVGALRKIMAEDELRLGTDLAFLLSNDGVHYGEDFHHTPFGTGVEGYLGAVETDREIMRAYLTGLIDEEKIRSFLHRCVSAEDVYQSWTTWCGRFSVTLGLTVADRLSRDLRRKPLEGIFLDYGTSLSEASLDVSGLEGLGPTAPNNFHHWVGYPSVAYG